MVTWNEYRSWLNVAHEPFGVPPPTIDRWHTDSRSLNPGDWFVPLVGENFDGHKFIDVALKKGAEGFLYNESSEDRIDPALKPKGIRVSDTLLALQSIAHGWRNSLKNTKIFALTGSSGKTTTKEMLAAILNAAGDSYCNEKNYNNEIGVPLTLCQIRQSHRYAALEFGARHTGDIALLSKISEPDICCLLNVGQAHVGVFGSVDALVKAKMEIFTSSKSDSVWIANIDDKNIMSYAHNLRANTITFGTSANAKVRVLDAQATINKGMLVTIAIAGQIIPITLSTFHTAYPHNVAACCAMAHAAGIPFNIIKEGLESFTSLSGRFYRHNIGSKVVIDDTYNANPESMRRGLETLEAVYPAERKALILGDMLELGVESTRCHRELGQFCHKNISFEYLYTIGLHSEEIGREVLRLGFDESKVRHFTSAETFIGGMESIAMNSDVFYLKGSHSIRLHTIIDTFMQKLP